MKTRKLFLMGCVLLSGCSSSTDSSPEAEPSPYTFSLSNFKPTSQSQSYVLWFSFNSSPFEPVLRFHVNDAGHAVNLDGSLPLHFTTAMGKDLHSINTCLISLEQTDTATFPSSRLIAGPMLGTPALGTCSMTSIDTNALGYSFSVGGVATLFDPRDTSQERSRKSIWFVDTTDTLAMHPGLENLPDIFQSWQWKYEGWILDSASFPLRQFSTGVFSSAQGKDNDPGDPLNFPGGYAPLAITNGNFQIAVSLEPKQDNDPKHSSPVMLATGWVPKDAVRGTKVQLFPVSFPSATISIAR